MANRVGCIQVNHCRYLREHPGKWNNPYKGTKVGPYLRYPRNNTELSLVQSYQERVTVSIMVRRKEILLPFYR